MRILRLLAAFAVLAAGSATAGSVEAVAQAPRALSSVQPLEAGILVRVNAIRARNGLKPLRYSARLRSAAASHSRQMALRGFFEHESPDGSEFWRRVERFYPSRGYSSWSVGENLLWSTGSPTPAFSVREWMLSPPHRRTILDRSWREVGIAALYATSAPGVYGGRAVTIVTADFGSRG